MGVSTDAYLLYGYVFSEEESEGWEYLDEMMEIASQNGCELGIHCSDDFPMYFLAAEDSLIKARRGYPKPIVSLTEGADWKEYLDTVVRALQIKPTTQVPGWWLCSYWG